MLARMLAETAVRIKDKSEPKDSTIPPLLGGQIMEAMLKGQALPRNLMSAVIRRIRADGHVNACRAAICKAVVNRTTGKEEIPVSLDIENTNPAYRLGRLFAMLEKVQKEAVGQDITGIRDRYFSAASGSPARTFPILLKTANHHLAKAQKGEKSGLGYWMEREIGKIWQGLGPDLPHALLLEDQGRFIAGYYHQKKTKHQKQTRKDRMSTLQNRHDFDFSDDRVAPNTGC